MVIYEVNLKISSDCFDDFYSWLQSHVKEMLTFPGFKNAELIESSQDKSPFIDLTVQYSVDSMSDVTHYLTHHAERMRDEGLSKFSGKFTASRRILE